MRQIRRATRLRLCGNSPRLLVEGRKKRKPLCSSSHVSEDNIKKLWNNEALQVWIGFKWLGTCSCERLFLNTLINLFYIATDHVLDGPGIESRWGGRYFPHPSSPALVAHPGSCTMGTGSFPGVKRPERGVDQPPSSIVRVKERVELYVYSPSGSSMPVLEWTLPKKKTLLLLKRWGIFLTCWATVGFNRELCCVMLATLVDMMVGAMKHEIGPNKIYAELPASHKIHCFFIVKTS